MYIQQFYTACLSEAAYYIESEGEVVIIDPLRDIDAYIELADHRQDEYALGQKYPLTKKLKQINVGCSANFHINHSFLVRNYLINY